MKKLYFIVGLLSCTIFAQTSMTVKGTSYMYVKNSYVFVKNGIDLQTANNFIYLRNEGQLLQGRVGANANIGPGKVSVFQEGTVNNYGYNYWCSPIGDNTASNLFGITLVNRPTDKTNSVAAVALPYATKDGTSVPLQIASRWIYTFSGLNYSDWAYVGGATTIPPGLGFSMKGTSGTDDTPAIVAAVGETVANNPGNAQRYDFKGKANSGTISIAVNPGQQTLTGNPYSSAINLNYFLLENSGYTINYLTGLVSSGGPTNVITGTAEYWEHQKSPAPTSHNLITYVGGYGIYSPNNTNANSPGSYGGATWNTYNNDGSINSSGALTGSSYKRMFSPIGQGFMITGNATGGNAVMKDIYRAFVKEGITNNSQFERSAASTNTYNWDEIPNVAGVDYTQFSKQDVPQIKIHTIMNNQYSREITLAFNSNTTNGFDPVMDAYSSEIDLPNDVYFSINNMPNKFLINTMPFNINERIPFTIKASSASNFKVSVANLINFNQAENVYLYDSTTGVYHDILNDFFEVSLPQGTYTNRFEITFVNETLNSTKFNKDQITVYQNNVKEVLTIKNPDLLKFSTIKLYDIVGKQILNLKDLNITDSYEFPTSTYSDGVYIVKIISKDNKEFSQKVIISNTK